jgi:hypothetical protein
MTDMWDRGVRDYMITIWENFHCRCAHTGSVDRGICRRREWLAVDDMAIGLVCSLCFRLALLLPSRDLRTQHPRA